jgi:putative transposase
MPYWQLFHHLVWTTKGREPLVTPEIEPTVYGFLRAKAIGLGAVLFALGGTEDHVHLVAAIPPSIAVSTFVRQVKAVASTKFNKSGNSAILYWQNEYGAFSFDGKRLPNVVAYVENQKQHHSQNQLIPVLERTNDGGVVLLRDAAPAYLHDHQSWWDGLLTYPSD